MTTKGFFISREEIKSEIRRNLESQNRWQAAFCKAANADTADTATAEINKRRAIRAGHRAQAITDFLEIACCVSFNLTYDFDNSGIEHYHPISTIEIHWTPEEKEVLEIAH